MAYCISLTKRKGLKLEVAKLRRKRNETRNNRGKKKVKTGEREKIGVRSLINPHPLKKKPKGEY